MSPLDSELPILRYIFVHHVREFPFLDKAKEKEFWQDKLQVVSLSRGTRIISGRVGNWFKRKMVDWRDEVVGKFTDGILDSSYNRLPTSISRPRKIDWRRQSAESYLSNARNWSS